MALQKDNFFSLSKSERRATLLLLIIIVLLIVARLVQHYYHSRIKEHPAQEYIQFQTELEEFNRTLQKDEKSLPDQKKKEEKGSTKKVASPKELKPVPREE